MLFQSDLFSSSRPPYKEPSATLPKEGASAFERDFEPVVGRCLSVSQYGGSEVNSKNFKVETPEGTFLIKRISADEISNHEKACVIASALDEQGAPIACPVAARDGAFVSCDERGGWSIWKFVDGDYFTGQVTEMANTAQAIKGFQSHLSRLPTALWPEQKVVMDASHISSSFDDVKQARPQWQKIFDENSLLIMEHHWPSVLAAASSIKEIASSGNTLPLEPTHFDLHPHNILMRNHHVSTFLDVDSILKYPPLVALGFAAFKLFRQHVARLNGSEGDPALREIFVAFSTQLAPQYSAPQILEGARLEVSRRVTYILNEFLSEGKCDWGHVLGIQLSALAEISWLLDEA